MFSFGCHLLLFYGIRRLCGYFGMFRWFFLLFGRLSLSSWVGGGCCGAAYDIAMQACIDYHRNLTGLVDVEPTSKTSYQSGRV